VLFNKQYLDHKIKVDNVGRTCGKHGTGRNTIHGKSELQRSQCRNKIMQENNNKINTKPENMRVRIAVIAVISFRIT
jgi:hypothetical protein